MPTGYTCDIANDITFKQFVLNCARAFGALILMRDDPADAPIPDEFKPSTYHTERLAEAHKEHAELLKLSDREKAQRAEAAHHKAMLSRDERLAKDRDLRRKYELMLEKVRNWTPPSSEHVGMKEFMIDQIESSIKFDCGEPELPTKFSGDAWFEDAVSDVLWSIDYHTKEQAAEEKRAAERTLWVQQLKQSLAKESG